MAWLISFLEIKPFKMYYPQLLLVGKCLPKLNTWVASFTISFKHSCSYHCSWRKHLWGKAELAWNLCSHWKVPSSKFQWIVCIRTVGGLRNSCNGNGCDSIRSHSLNLRNKRGALGAFWMFLPRVYILGEKVLF